LRAVVIHQGESNQRNASTYMDLLDQMVADLRAEFDDPTFPFVFGEVGAWNPAFSEIRDVMKKIPETIPFSRLVSSADLTNRDNAHFDRQSILILGRRYADVYWELIKSY